MLRIFISILKPHKKENSIFMGLQNTNENMFYGLGTVVILLWKSLGNILKQVCTIPVSIFSK